MQAGNLTDAELLWATQLTVRLVLADGDVSQIEPPPVQYCRVSRQSYLHTLIPEALSLLHSALPPGERSPWFDYNSLPLKWNVPAGVIYDLLVPLHDVEPWPLTLHVRGFPSAVLPACGGEPALRGALLNSLKEAAFICSGTAERVQAMSAGPQDDLWRAVVSADARRHSEVLGSLQLSRPGERQSLSVPVRIFIRDAAGGQYLSSYAGIRYTSRPVAARRPDGAPATLLDALRPLVEADAGGDVENKLSRVYVGGVLPPLDAPLAALHARLRGPDHFLYVVAHLAVPSAAGAATNPI